MKLTCAPTNAITSADLDGLRVVLYGQPSDEASGSAGDAAKNEIVRQKLDAEQRAWDLLSVALSAVVADRAVLRDGSPDGWTRELEVCVAVSDPDFWRSQASSIAAALQFLTTDIWTVRFEPGGQLKPSISKPADRDEDCVVLLSGGLDSLVGAVDLAVSRKPLAISQTVRGDAEKQIDFAAKIGTGIGHLQLNHNAHTPGDAEDSQRARSFIFVAFGVLAATTLRRYREGERVELFVCENGFIALNPPLTGARIGSLSTRTAHPEFLGRLQSVLGASGLRVDISNPYAAKTKGEMLKGGADQALLTTEAAKTTSCGRFQRYNYKHCGRCVPCQVRRAAFVAWGMSDTTPYVYDELGQDDDDHAGFDDVRSVAMALAQVDADGVDSWLGPALCSSSIARPDDLKQMVQRGLGELKALHMKYGVK